MLGFDDVFEADDAVAHVLDFDPVGLEGLDSLLRDHISKKGGRHANSLSSLPDGEGWLFVEIGADDKREALERAERLVRKMRARSHLVISDEAEQKKLWEVRESGLGATAFVPGESDTWPGWEDAAVPPARVGKYLRDFRKLCDSYGYHPSLYGHFGQGCIHCRIDFRLTTDEGVARYRAFVNEAADLVVHHGGSLSGEHGDGQSRAELLPKMFGEELVAAFRRFKRIWDPDWKMNPGKIVDPNPLDRFLKLGGDYHP